ncbi:MAG: 2-dehydropantoate 2-reductase [Pseudonocardiaceae bacterium]|nr:2-dehydropantoate 2-reductase [Pseudonocardiaceae bacterium]
MTSAENDQSPRDSRVAVVGGGAIGGFTAAQLSSAGWPVTVCVRTPFDQLVLDTPNGRVHADVEISADPATQQLADWVLVTTKAQDTAGAAAWLARLTGPNTVVVLLQNGVDHAERVAGLVDAGTVLPALVYAPVERVAPGHMVWHAAGRFVVPTGQQATRFSELFAGTDVEVDVTDDFRTAAWRKLLSNIAANPLTALTLRRMDMMREPDVRALATTLMREAVAVARADGADVDDQDVQRIFTMWDSFDPGGGSSMLYDRLAGRPLEHEYLTGAVVAYAERHGVDVPLNRAMLTLLRALASS